MKFLAKFAVMGFLMCLHITSSWSAMVIEGTRVVVRGGDRETLVRMSNQGNVPLVVQSWIDNGEADRNKSPDQIQVPFALTPPIARVDPSKGQTVRIYPAAEPLPTDRETLFWFNALEIPPKTKNADENIVQFTIRSRLKLFYRPPALGRDVPREAIQQVKWTLETDSNGQKVLRAHNHSPYHFTFGQGETSLHGQTIKLIGDMASPHGTVDLRADKGIDLTGSKTFKLNYINDFGAAVDFVVELP